MTERELTTKLIAKLKQSKLQSCAIEVKITKTDSLPFSTLAEHQLQALQYANNNTFVFKIPDSGPAQNPFDIFILRQAEAYVAVIFYRPYKPIIAYLIHITDWKREQLINDRKSLTQERALFIASHEFRI